MYNTKGTGGRNTFYYKSRVSKTKKVNNNFFDNARKRQMNSYLRSVALVTVLIFVVTGFIVLGVFLQNLTAEEIEPGFMLAYEGAAVYGYAMRMGAPPEEETAGLSDISAIFYNFRGVYLDVRQLEDLDDLQNFIDRVKLRDINAVRIDIKRQDGIIPFRINGHFSAIVGEDNEIELRIQDIIEMLHANGMYVSGKITCFRDDLASGRFPTWALTDSATGVRFSDAGNSSWLNIYSEDARNHIKTLVAESVRLGFDEIILDYFFLPNVPDTSRIIYNDNGIGKNTAVRNFVTDVRATINEISPDVRLGLNFPIQYFLNAPNAAMGLNPDELIHSSDFFTTSFAPSHLPQGALGLTNPAGNPYETVGILSARFSDTASRIMLRPDLQAFDDENGIIYDANQILSQRQALSNAGITVWTLINYDNNY